jgi:transcription-repair coupling factor (superfamily II helicase)
VRKIIHTKKGYSDPALINLLDKVLQGERATTICGLNGSSHALVTSILFNNTKRTLLYISPSDEEANNAFRDLIFFLGEENVCLFPSCDILYLDDVLSYQRDISARRVRILYKLLSGKPSVVVVPLSALVQKVMPMNVIMDYTEVVSKGDYLERERLIEKLIEGGYERASLVEEEGEFSVRGYIIDIFPPTGTNPLRMEFMGDEIESIREFDVTTQRSSKEVNGFVLSPAGELVLSAEAKEQALKNLRIRAGELDLPKGERDRLFNLMENDSSSLTNLQLLPLFYNDFSAGGNDGLNTLFDYVSKNSLVVWDNFHSMGKSVEKIENDLDRFVRKAAERETFYLEREFFHIPGNEILEKYENLQRVFIESLPLEGSDALQFQTEHNVGLKQEMALLGREDRILKPLADRIEEWVDRGDLITFLCGEGEIRRMTHLLEEYSLRIDRAHPTFLADLESRTDGKGRLVIREGKITEGFSYPGLNLVVVGEEEIFGKKIKKKRRARAREGYFLKSFGELKEKDFVVHVDHGIGIYQELKRLKVGDIENEFILIEYFGGDKLYIPVDRLDQIQRYIGPDGHAPGVDKLGGTSWESVKKRVKKSVREVAEELVSIYAAREVLEGNRFSPANGYYEEFESSFEFEETPDQARSIEDVNQDLSDQKPMDRLVCGDAGFGKTEVALRASFRVSMDGKQVAVLVPTTILAEQHYQTFMKRFEKYPVRIEVLNRFKTKNQQNKIVEDINKGLVDIVIGTHRLLQKDVLFKDLGLVIIDEEQRFGVSHKEKLKKLRTLVDVLTLTATPIPRTLQLSLVGIRDLSIIDTPPEDRRSVRVHVSEFDEDVIREAIRKELTRGGQVFFVHDRVRSISSIARFVEGLVPEARIGVAHGQMKARELEDVMIKFVQREFDVLVCTTIIGSGVDIPTANTIIINRADRFGLSHLYQLRGRVGRSDEEAYAHLLIPEGASLSRNAKKRLRVAQEFSEPGSGFKVATHDLEIRGGGNLLGVSQSGHISAVGFELYTELMEKTIRELKGEKTPEEEISPEIHFGMPAFIPDDYISDMHSRLVTYKKISMAASDDALFDVREELADRYGFVPEQVENLMDIISVRNLLKEVKAEKMEYDGRNMFIAFRENSPVDPEVIIRLSKKKFKGLRFTPDFKLFVPMPGIRDKDIVAGAKGLIEDLMKV